MSDTPQTDAATVDRYVPFGQVGSHVQKMVHADFARALERRVAELEAERDQWHKVALGWNADCELGLERERQSRALTDNLAMLLRRFIWFARRLDGDREIKVLAAKAAQFLNDTGLGGSVLREEDRTELRKIADEINRIAPEPK